MELDESGWPDIEERLNGSTHSTDNQELLIRHLTDRLISHLGVDVIDCWVGKDGLERHSVREVAAAAIAHLSPIWDQVPPTTLAKLESAGELGTPIPPPWDDHWRRHPRTSSWRS